MWTEMKIFLTMVFACQLFLVNSSVSSLVKWINPTMDRNGSSPEQLIKLQSISSRVSLDSEVKEHYISNDDIRGHRKSRSSVAESIAHVHTGVSHRQYGGGNDYDQSKKQRQTVGEEDEKPENSRKSWLASNLPKVNVRCDPLINFKLKQRFVLLGTAVTLGVDYLTDLAHWRTYCAIEDTLVRGRFSLRGSELGWAKSWMLNLGLGEENTAKFKLRLGLNLKSCKAYAKLRFRTEPISPFDIGEGVSCAGKVPVPLDYIPPLRHVPLRVEYVVRVNTARPTFSLRSSSGVDNNKEQKVCFSTGLEAIDLSLDELNFCLEWDEKSPLWAINLVKSEPSRKKALHGAGRKRHGGGLDDWRADSNSEY